MPTLVVDFSQLHTTMEFKVRRVWDIRPWEEIQVFYTIDAENKAEEQAAMNFVLEYFSDGTREFRWNWYGSSQGNYVAPKEDAET